MNFVQHDTYHRYLPSLRVKRMTLYLAMVKVMRLVLRHIARLFKSCRKRNASEEDSTLRKILTSSAYNKQLQYRKTDKLNKRGPRWEPWGTPGSRVQIARTNVWSVCFYVYVFDGLASAREIAGYTEEHAAREASSFIMIAWLTVPKAFRKSVNMTSSWWPYSKLCEIW